MHKLMIPAPISAGLLLSYKCNSRCRHCLYACSPQWKADWLSVADAEDILSQLAPRMLAASGPNGSMGVNRGLHFTGGEPFLNFELLVEVVAIAHRLGIHSTFVETNCYWCTDEQTALDKLSQLKQAGLDGMLISANPFVLEYVPFERTLRAARIGGQVFPGGVLVYQPFFYQQFCDLGTARHTVVGGVSSQGTRWPTACGVASRGESVIRTVTSIQDVSCGVLLRHIVPA